MIARIYHLLFDVGNGQLTKPSGVVVQRVIERSYQQTNQLALYCAAAFCALCPIYEVTPEPVTADCCLATSTSASAQRPLPKKS